MSHSFFSKVSHIFKAALARKARREQAIGESTGLTLLSHIQQLRTHVVRALVWLVLFSCVCFGFMKPILFYLKRPYDLFLQTQHQQNSVQNLTSLSIFEVMTVNFKICFFMGFALSLPFIIYEIWKFVAPALYASEKNVARLLIFFSIVLFYGGLAFGYYLIIPYFFKNALEWASDYAQVMITYESYFNTLCTMLLIFAAVFEVPVILSLLGLAGLLPSHVLVKNRKFVFLACFILGAILAPPDVLSLCLVAFPMYTMVEISIVILKRIEKKRLLAKKIL